MATSTGQSGQLPPPSDTPIREQPPTSTTPAERRTPPSATPPIPNQPSASSAPPTAGEQSTASATLTNGGAEAFTFPAYLELLKEARRQNCRQAVVMHPELLTPARCGYCGQLEDLGPTSSAIPKHKPDIIHGAAAWFPRAVTCQSSCFADQAAMVGGEDISREEDAPLWAATLLDMVAYEGNSCFKCAKVIYDKTQKLFKTRKGPQFTRHGPDLLCEIARECRDGDTALHCAARSKGVRMMCHLISLVGEEYGHEKAIEVLRKSNSRMETPLHEAIRLDSEAMVELLMWVDPELAQFPAAGQAGTSPLYLAVAMRRDHIAQMLYRASGTNLSYSGPDGQNVLHAALLTPYSGIIENILDWNKDLSKDKDQNGSTPLHFAVLIQQEPFFRICYIHFRNIWFPLVKLATWHILDANPSAAYQPNNHGFFPIHLAAQVDRTTAIRILLKRCPGCMNLRDNEGRSFLHIAVHYKSLSVVRYACQESIFAPLMNARDNEGNTALHIAVEVGDLSVFCTLLANQEVFLNLWNNKNQTPTDLAFLKIGISWYQWNPETMIYNTLATAGGCPASLFTIGLHSESVGKLNPEHEEKQSAKLTDSTRTLGIGMVLIASVTFGATFTVAGMIKAADNGSGGKTTISFTWYFKAFMIANTLAFISATLATIGLMFSGIPMVELPIRWKHFATSMNFAISSLICWAAAFAIGVYMVLAPVGRTTAIAISASTPIAVIFFLFIREFLRIAVIIPPLRARRGIIFCLSALWIEYFRY